MTQEMTREEMICSLATQFAGAKHALTQFLCRTHKLPEPNDETIVFVLWHDGTGFAEKIMSNEEAAKVTAIPLEDIVALGYGDKGIMSNNNLSCVVVR